jgi:hypothetical protein
MDRAICHTLLCAKGVVLSVVSKSGRGQYGKNKKSAIKSRAPATAPRITTISVVIAIRQLGSHRQYGCGGTDVAASAQLLGASAQ